MAEDKDKGRKLRPKERRTYSDLDIDEDEIEGRRTFNLEEKLSSTKYSKSYVKELTSAEVNLTYFQENGFSTPIFIKEKSGLGMRMPSENFTVSDVKSGVGSRRVLDVMDVTTQKAMEMTMKEWVKYYENPQKDRLLNVISLEFSHTKLDNYVEKPNIVKQIDWVDNVWPQHLKDCQTESTNIIQRMKYPKVQKYCLMSVRGCYTDFHIDMSGTSVWYHILRGAKIFWLIPPTDQNLELYENWTLSGKQGDMFFADQVEGCQRINLEAGNTFLIPTGWIHAVYTPCDSLVFGGNYLHSLNIPMQLRIWEVEEKTHVPHKFRYPFFQEIHWYVLDRYLTCIADKSYREKSTDELQEEKENKIKTESAGESADDKTGPGSSMEEHSLERSPLDEHGYISSPKMESPQSPGSMQMGSLQPGSPKIPQSPGVQEGDGEAEKVDETEKTYANPSDLIKPVSVKLENCMLIPSRSATPLSQGRKSYIHLNKYELEGLAKAIAFLHKIPVAKKQIPRDIAEPEALIADAESMLKEHAADDQNSACTGENHISWPPRQMKPKMRSYTYPRVQGPKSSKSKDKDSGVSRRRRVRCKRCEPCRRSDCGECSFCRDMKKYGGPGRMKQSCMARQCMVPELPNSAVCAICNIDERDEEAESGCVTKLMECGICWQIVHPECVSKNLPEELQDEGTVNEDLPNSWECPKCCHAGKQGMIKPRSLKVPMKKSGRTSASSSDDEVRTDDDVQPLANREKGDSSDTSQIAPRRPRGRPMKNRGDETSGTPTKKLKRDDEGQEQGGGRGAWGSHSSWQVRNQSISHDKEQVNQRASAAVPVVNGDGRSQSVHVNGESIKPEDRITKSEVQTPETKNDKLLTVIGGSRKAVVVIKQIDCVHLNGKESPPKEEKTTANISNRSSSKKLVNGDCNLFKLPKRKSSENLKTSNLNGKGLNGKTIISTSPKKSARIAGRKKAFLCGKNNGSLKLNDETKLILCGKFAQPIVILERTSAAPVKLSSVSSRLSSSAKSGKKLIQAKMVSSPHSAKKMCLAVSPTSPPGTVAVSARSGRFIVKPSRFFD